MGNCQNLWKTSTGVCRNCSLSLMIFAVVVDWNMRELEDHDRAGIEQEPTPPLHDLDDLDDLENSPKKSLALIG